MLGQLALVVGGLILVSVGAEALVRGASRGAARLGISPLVVGLTVVAFGTSAPEIALGLFAVAEGKVDLALGNVVGSNTFNVLFILGLSALVTPLSVAQQLVRVDAPLLFGVSVAVLLLSLDGAVGRVEGALLLAGLVGYTGYTIRAARRESPEVRAEYASGLPARQGRQASLLWNGLLLVAGLALLTGGARLLVMGAAGIARAAGISDLVIGLTVLAAGTSVPEVATSLVAALRGERDIAVGNVVGSCLFNLLGVLGLTAVCAPGGVPVPPAALLLDLPVMLAAAAACLPIFFTGHRIDRWEGAVLLGFYVAYVAYLVLDATEHHATATFGAALLFVVPLSALTLLVIALRTASRARAARA